MVHIQTLTSNHIHTHSHDTHPHSPPLTFTHTHVVLTVPPWFPWLPQVLGQWNDSLASLQRSLELSAGEEVVMAMYTTVQCQVMMERAFVEHSRRLEVTRRKLHEFYETLHTLRLSRVTAGR